MADEYLKERQKEKPLTAKAGPAPTVAIDMVNYGDAGGGEFRGAGASAPWGKAVEGTSYMGPPKSPAPMPLIWKEPRGEKAIPGLNMPDYFAGGQTIVSGATGGEVTLPPGQGMGLDMLYIMDPKGFSKAFPAFVTEDGSFDEAAVQRTISRDLPADKARPAAPGKPALDWTDRSGFAQVFFQQMGNPFTFNPYKEVEKANALLPELFNNLFQGKVQWSDRANLDREKATFWNAKVQEFRAKVFDMAKIEHENMKSAYRDAMTQFDAMANRAFTVQESRRKERIAGEKEAAKIARPEKLTSEDYDRGRTQFRADLKKPIETPDETGARELSLKLWDSLHEENPELTPTQLRQQITAQVEDSIRKYWEDLNDLEKKTFRGKPVSRKESRALIEELRSRFSKAMGFIPMHQPPSTKR
jgi:hypothetical protein